jgi:hypothetical protein
METNQKKNKREQDGLAIDIGNTLPHAGDAKLFKKRYSSCNGVKHDRI